MTGEIVLHVAIVVEGKSLYKSLTQYGYSEGAMSNDAACNYLLHKSIGPHSLPLPAWSSWSRNKEKIKWGNFFIHSMCLYSICVCMFINTYKHRQLYIHTQTHRHTDSNPHFLY